ncbi:MAG: AraC family transcriptional regulator [Lentimicrobium sp.]|nr:AraC family transcriptional regulator [Lentimicrobium sp.]
MSFQVAHPSPLLSGFVKQYWAIENCLSPGERHIQRIVPNGLTELTFYFGNKPGSLDEKRHPTDHALLSGHLKGYYDIVVTNKLSMFSVSFQPFGACLFFNLPASELFDLTVPLNLLLKNQGTEMEDRLNEADSFKGRINVMETFLISRLKANLKEWETKRILNIIGLINNSRGGITIEALASAACLSRKQFERTFTACIGTSPKQFLRTVRFQHSLYQKQKRPDIPLTELAYRCGYFDQSHMIADFKSFSGKTPTQYFGECEPYSDYFSQT